MCYQGGMKRLLPIVAILILASAPAVAGTSLHMPGSTRGTKYCGHVTRFGYSFRVYVTKGRRLVSCRGARGLVRKPPLNPIRGWRYYDWTKGGNRNGPWTDVYERRDHRAVVGAIIRA